jgi:hypothetical protein
MSEINNAPTLTNLIDPTTFNTAMRPIAQEYAKLLGVITFKNYASRLIDVLDRINTARTYNFATQQITTSPIELIPAPTPPPTETETPTPSGGCTTPHIIDLVSPEITLYIGHDLSEVLGDQTTIIDVDYSINAISSITESVVW